MKLTALTQITTTLETNIWGDFLMKQAPVIVVLGLFCYFMYKYFTSQIDRKDKKLDEQQASLMDLYGKAVDAEARTCLVQEQLLDILKETKADVNKLSEKISQMKD